MKASSMGEAGVLTGGVPKGADEISYSMSGQAASPSRDSRIGHLSVSPPGPGRMLARPPALRLHSSTLHT